MFNLLKKKQKQEIHSSKGEDIYYSMRNMAFNIKPEDIGITLDDDNQVYGSIIDMNTGAGIATMVCFIDGTASLYFSNGGGILGTGNDESVRKAVTSYLVSIHQVLPIMKEVDEYDNLPQTNHHIFYLFTRTGKYSIDIDLKDINTKEMNFLFSLSQMVLSEIRKVNEKGNE